MSKIIENLWFKKNSKARKWLEKNLSLENSFSKTFRTTGGTFKYYDNEFLLKRCSIEACNYQSVGSFPSKGGAKLSLCQMHIIELEQMQVASQPLVFVITGIKIGAMNLLPLLLYKISESISFDISWLRHNVFI